jgi:hypothetical protein
MVFWCGMNKECDWNKAEAYFQGLLTQVVLSLAVYADKKPKRAFLVIGGYKVAARYEIGPPRIAVEAVLYESSP